MVSETQSPVAPQPFAWHVERFERNGKSVLAETIYKPMLPDILANLRRSYTVIVTELFRARPQDELEQLLDKAACLLNDAALSEDGVDGDDALKLIDVINGKFEELGKTTTEHSLMQIYQAICKAAGVSDQDEIPPLEALEMALNKAGGAA